MAIILYNVGIRIDFVLPLIVTLSNREIVTGICFVSYDCAVNFGYDTSPPFLSAPGGTNTSGGSVLPTMTLSARLKDAKWALRGFSASDVDASSTVFRGQSPYSGMFA